jgi:hypothetical protein
MMQPMSKRFDGFKIAVFLSSLSMVFGILREFLIVGLLGFTATNDKLQLYLSVFYTIGLTIDAMRLACLNLYAVLSLPRILLAASLISLPFCFMIGFVMSYSTGGLNLALLLIAILGSYLNLMAAVLITYKQRDNMFLAAQLINVLPNFILIPGIIICYWFASKNLIFSIVCLVCLIPIAQCILLLLLPKQPSENAPHNSISLWASIMTFARHFAAMISEQMYQIIARAAFFNYGPGYLSLFAMAVRIYAAARFILVDSFIGSKLANWKIQLQHEADYFSKMINLTYVSLFIVMISLLISFQSNLNIIYSSLQMTVIFIFGFYFSTLVRLAYFKINRYENNPSLVLRFAMLELLCVLAALLLTKQLNYPILTLLWIGYVAKPFGQLLLLRKHYHGLALNYGNK